MSENKFPKGWDQHKVSLVLGHYENQAEDDALLEDEVVAGQSTGQQSEGRGRCR